MSSVLEFLIELDEKKSVEMISQCYSQKSTLLFKTEASPHMIRATINSLSDKKVILHTEPADAAIKLETDVSIKFNIGTEVYFIKAPIKSYLNNYYFDFSAAVIQLKRRREPRYQIPKKWSQAAFLLNYRTDMRMVNCIVHDISLFGIRLEILNTSIKLDTGIKVSIQFKVHKRAEITCEALVRFYSQRKGLGTIAGLEFVQLRPVQQEKINSIVEDLIQHIAMTKV